MTTPILNAQKHYVRESARKHTLDHYKQAKK